MPRGVMGVGVGMDSVLPALKKKTKKFRLFTKTLFACQSVALGRGRRGYRDRMSLMEHGAVRPVTAVAWTSNSSTCPKDFTLISITEDGAAANFTRSFAMKSGYYLCYSKELTAGMVVSDIQLISDKDSIPHGYCYIAEHLEAKASVWKKKRVCVRIVPVGSVDSAVLDIKVTAKSKMMLQHYTYVGDVHGYVLWCRKGHFSGPIPQAKPRSVSLDIRSLSLEQPSAPLPLRPSNPPARPLPPNKLSQRRQSLHNKDNCDKSADGSIQGITALDGVPFSLHPKFDIQANGMALQLNSQLNNIRIKSLQDIENEYNYTFAVEESAAKRTRPSVPTGSAPSAQ
ncbi:LOW QUALITY PROTEIN: multivesicular body subunit 12A [Anoplopoma fimbria]|uniref:LOW QUALITY PROTEIN: multivesicular body subunit 12A n=1 Tax=Anoplopoma fimbria TaxID=229290 RepID=UPI0023EBEF21|nr:LOW QUALITY PROTEIN: multivesicular body subunit 12A [Anoplopoma fimbria]